MFAYVCLLCVVVVVSRSVYWLCCCLLIILLPLFAIDLVVQSDLRVCSRLYFLVFA